MSNKTFDISRYFSKFYKEVKLISWIIFEIDTMLVLGLMNFVSSTEENSNLVIERLSNEIAIPVLWGNMWKLKPSLINITDITLNAVHFPLVGS